MDTNVKKAAKAVIGMDKHLRNDLLQQKSKLWENTYIKHQIDSRNQGNPFTIEDHIKAMVYAMLSSGISWKRVENGIDNDTGNIIPIDKIFYQYNIKKLQQSSAEELRDKIKEINCASQYTLKQMTALLNDNIEKLISFENEYVSIDTYYQTFIDKDSSFKLLIKALSSPTSKDKMSQMGEALTAEYLRNVGYDTSKPDRHIRRILGSKHLSCSEYETVPIFEAFDIVAEIASELNKPVAEVDYILWSYCANGYGEICTLNKPKCDKCVVKEICNYKKGI